MSFPPSARVVYEKNPLVEVVCQLRFPPILAISAQEPAAFQERIRRTYPLYERGDAEAGLPAEVPAEIASILAGLRVQFPGDQVVHRFLTEDGKRLISLTRNFVAVSEKAYHRWEEFRQEIELAEAAVNETYQPVFYQRVGLRYQDIVDRDRLNLADVSWDELLKPAFAGLLSAQDVKQQIQSANSAVVIKLNNPSGGMVRVQHGLVDLRRQQRTAYLFDADFYIEGKCSHDDAFAALEAFHGHAGNLFRWAITERLQLALGPQPVD